MSRLGPDKRKALLAKIRSEVGTPFTEEALRRWLQKSPGLRPSGKGFILSFVKPKKLVPTKVHNNTYVSCSGVEGT